MNSDLEKVKESLTDISRQIDESDIGLLRARREWGGADVQDVVRARDIALLLPICNAGKSIVAGVSRGGMMSYLLAAREPWVKAVISLAGTADLIAGAHDVPEMAEIFKQSFGGSEDEMHKRSAVHFYDAIPKELPLLIMHGEADDRVSVDSVRRLHQLLADSGHAVEYHEFPTGTHYFAAPDSPHREDVLKIIAGFVRAQQAE